MQDHYYSTPDGQKIAVAQLPIELIQAMLSGQIRIVAPPGTSMENIEDRLRIELTIRELGL